MDAIVKHKLPIHPAADLIPEMAADEYQALRSDIAEHGQRDPITMFNGAILDGRHRYRATWELGLDPLTETWSGNAPEAFVISRNLKRRHLTTSQRALLAAEYAKAPVGKSAKLRDKVPTVAEAAKLFVVSERSIHTARHIAEHAPAETVAKLRAGLISLNEADLKPTTDSPSMRRQAWLETAASELRPWFKEAGYTIPENIRIGVVSPSRRNMAGLCYPPKASSDGHYEVYVGSHTNDGVTIIEILAHELCHAVVMAKSEKDIHGPLFQECAAAVGLLPPWRATMPGPTLTAWAEDFIKRHGPYPGGKFVLPEPKPPRVEDDTPEPKPTEADLERYDFENLQSWLSFQADPPHITRLRGLTPEHRKELAPLIRKIAKDWIALADKLEHEVAGPEKKSKRK